MNSAAVKSLNTHVSKISASDDVVLAVGDALVDASEAADTDTATEESELLTRWEMIKLCIPVIPSQLGWAVGEALLIPYLMSLGLAETTANSIWLVNPIVSFFVSPMLGSLSDRCTSRWGKRRPFLFLFHFGIIFGLVMIAFSPELHRALFANIEPFNSVGHASVPLLVIIFTGCVIMELSNDLLTIPSRALLNDCLPEEQVEAGNAWFSAMNSLGAVIGLTMCFLPLNTIYPLSLLDTQLRATFVACIGVILTSNLFTMTIEEWNENDSEGDGEDGNDIINDESEKLLGKPQHEHQSPPTANKTLSMKTVSEANEDDDEDIERQIDDNDNDGDDEEATEEEAEAEEAEAEEPESDPSHMGVIESLLAFRQLPPELIAIWFAQFSWWLVVMQGSFWWTTWVGIAVYHGDPVTESQLFYDGVTYGIVSTLIHAIVSFFASQALTFANAAFGVTRVYHFSAAIFSLSTMALWVYRSKEAVMIYMIFTGLLYPVINTNPFILIEVYTGYEDEEAEDETQKDDGGESIGESEKVVAASGHAAAFASLSPLRQSSFESQLYTSSGGSSSDDDSPVTETDNESQLSLSSATESDASDIGTPMRRARAMDASYSNLYDLSRSINDYDGYVPTGAYPFSDGEAVVASSHRGGTDNGAISPYQSPLPLSSLLPLAISSTVGGSGPSHGMMAGEPLSPESPHSALSPLISPGMVATVVQEARAANILLSPSVTDAGTADAEHDLSPLPPTAYVSSNNNEMASGRKNNNLSSLTAALSTPHRRPPLTNTANSHGTSIFSEAKRASPSGREHAIDIPSISNMDIGTTTPSIHAFIAKQNEESKSSAATADDDDTAVEEAEQELEAAEEAEAEYLKASTHRGIITAIFNLSMGLSQILSATLGGFLIHWFGDITIVFLLSGIFCLIVNGIVVLYGLSGKKEDYTEVAETVEEAVETEPVVEKSRPVETIDRRSAERNEMLAAEEERRQRKERKDRDRILRAFMREREEARDRGYGSTGAIAAGSGVPIESLLRRRKSRRLEELSSSLPSTLTIGTSPASTVPQPVPSTHHREQHRKHHRHRTHGGDNLQFDLIDRKRAQAWLMHALAQMSLMHSNQTKKGRTSVTSRPLTTTQPLSTARGQTPPTQSRSLLTATERTPLVSAADSSIITPSSSLTLPSPPIAATQSTQSPHRAPVHATGSTGGQPLHMMLSHPSHRRLLYEITVLLHYYHVNRIDRLPATVQEKIHTRLHSHLARHRSLRLHHRIDADITSRRGLTGRYATKEEIQSERERLHLQRKQRRKRKAKQFKRKLQDEAMAMASNQQPPASP